MINDNTARLFFPEGEVRELASPQGLYWEREVLESKARGEQAYVTRNNGIKGLKAYGATPVKHKADKLWGRYVPAVASDTTAYPMVLKNLFDGKTNIVLGKLIAIATGNITTDAQNFYCEDYFEVKPNTSYVFWGEKKSDEAFSTFNRIHFYDENKSFISSSNGGRAEKCAGVSPSNAKYARVSCNVLATGTLDQATVALFNWYFGEGTATTEYIPYGVWKFVKDIGLDGTGADFGYYNEATNEFVKAAGASGSIIQPIAYAESDGTTYADTDVKGTTTSGLKVYVDAEGVSGKSGSNVLVAANGLAGAGQWFGHNASYWTAGGSVVTNVDFDTRIQTTLSFGTQLQFTLNGTTYTRNGSITDNAGTSLFGLASSTAKAKAKLYSCKIWNNDALVRDYLPVRIGTTVELLDLVSWSFATRVGTFTAGADIPYTQIVPDIIKVNTGDIRYGVGKNLFNKNTLNSGGFLNSDGSVFSTGNWSYSDYIPVRPNTTYTVSGQGVTASTNAYNCYYNKNKQITGNAYDIAAMGNIFTFTTPNNPEIAYIRVNMRTGNTPNPKDTYQLEEGSQATPYEPYAKTIRTNGTHKVIVGSQGVIDLGSLSWVRILNSDEGYYYFTASNAIWKLSHSQWAVMASQEYSYIGIGGSGSVLQNKSYILHDYYYRIYIRDDRYTTVDEFKAAISGVMLFYQRNTDSAFVAPQIRDIPMLFSTDSNLDVQSGTKTEAWGAKVFDGTETISFNTTYKRFAFSGLDEKGETYLEGICTHYEVKSTTVEENDFCFSWSSSGTLHWKDSRFSNDITGMKAYLASEYAKGTPVIILYPLATPATEQVTIAPVTSARRTTYVADSDSELGALPVEMEYLGK